MRTTESRFLVALLIALLLLGSGAPLVTVGAIFLVLAGLGVVFTRIQVGLSDGMLAIKIASSLFLLALGWVLAISSSTWWHFALLALPLGAASWVLFIVRETSEAQREELADNDMMVVFSAISMILVIRGWIHFVPVVVATGASAALLRSRIPSRSAVFARVIAFGSIFGGSVASRWLLSESDIRIWMTYDQQFRASLATGLTRWGWANWNSAPGQEIHYHWLSEATAGLVSRLAGIDEFDSVSRVMPVLGIVAISLVSIHLLRGLNVKSTAAIAIVVPVIGLHPALEVFSIGTLWGGFWLISTTCILRNSCTSERNSGRDRTNDLMLVLLFAVALLTQSTVGITLGMVTGLIFLHQLVTSRRRFPSVFVTGLGLCAVAYVASQSILQSRSGTAVGADLRNFLKEGWRWHPADIGLIFMLVYLWHRKRVSLYDLLIPVAYAVASMLFVNFLRIGGHEGRLLSEAQLVITLFGFGSVTRVVQESRRHRPTQTQRLQPLRASCSLLLLTLVVGVGVYSYVDDARRSWGYATRSIFPLELVHGDREIDACLGWIRSNTPTDALIASNMWRTPRSDDQKYFLVSLKSKRQVLVDGPTYVANTGAYEDDRVLENLKNDVDYFIVSPSRQRLDRLRELQVDVLMVDESRKHSIRIGDFVTATMVNSKCSVYLI
jgi:hypothetical protein